MKDRNTNPDTPSEKSSRSMGICIGASTISTVILKELDHKIEIESFQTIPHQGNPKKVISKIFDAEIPTSIAITGKKFKN